MISSFSVLADIRQGYAWTQLIDHTYGYWFSGYLSLQSNLARIYFWPLIFAVFQVYNEAKPTKRQFRVYWHVYKALGSALLPSPWADSTIKLISLHCLWHTRSQLFITIWFFSRIRFFLSTCPRKNMQLDFPFSLKLCATRKFTESNNCFFWITSVHFSLPDSSLRG